MAGNREGALKGAIKKKQLYGEKFFSDMGKKGGSNSNTGGYASKKKNKNGLTGREQASLNGKKSKRNR